MSPVPIPPFAASQPYVTVTDNGGRTGVQRYKQLVRVIECDGVLPAVRECSKESGLFTFHTTGFSAVLCSVYL